MIWLLIHRDETKIDKVIVITGNFKKLQQYIIDNVEQLYDSFFECIVKNEHYQVNNNKLHTYLYQKLGYKLDSEKNDIIELIKEFYTRFPKRIFKTLKYYGGTNENDKYPMIEMIRCDDVTFV
uniref:Uncharacterized protein n=1 Tax=viral metagenome TaxID=1070528 RepID=A0A6C0C742_9ZZZZ